MHTATAICGVFSCRNAITLGICTFSIAVEFILTSQFSVSEPPATTAVGSVLVTIWERGTENPVVVSFCGDAACEAITGEVERDGL